MKNEQNLLLNINWKDKIKEFCAYSVFWFLASPVYTFVDRLMGDHVWSIALETRLFLANSGFFLIGEGVSNSIILAILSIVFVKFNSVLIRQYPKYDFVLIYCVIMTISTLYRADVVWEYYITATVFYLGLNSMHLSSNVRGFFGAALILVAI